MTQDSLSGGLGSTDFVWMARNETASLRRRYLAINYQILFAIIAAVIFLRNTYRAIYIVANYPHKIAPWCCLVINLVGVLLSVFITLPSIALGIASCNTLGWAIIAGVTISSSVTNVILFERAYLAYNRPMWFLILGAIMVGGSGPAYVINVWYSSTPRYNETHGCYFKYQSYFPYVRLSLDLPPNIIFSAIFSMVVYRQYKRYQEACWKKLAKDGVLTMLLIIASNIASFIINATNVFKETSDLTYVADWLLTATLLVNNTYNLHMLPESYTATKSRTKPTATSSVSIENQTTTRNKFGVTGMTTTYMFE
ncbi:hypothetical protein BDF19DRAFT_463347 [Syncephalis fuscata]|nr:hypothetical protein BDF19DRAFT_463347 [Syncephalis fuscata]